MKTPIISKPLARVAAHEEGGFRTPGGAHGHSFLDQTTDSGPGNSYDITLYEDLDEDLNHRKDKPVPEWAKNSKTFIFSK